MRGHHFQKGFTLIELLVVISIIALLASIVLASLNSARVKSRDVRRISNIKQLQLALELYFDANGSYPAGGIAALTGVLNPTYIPVIPDDPLAGGAPNNYEYCRPTTTSYQLGANLEETTNPGLSTDRDLSNAACASGEVIEGADADGCSDEAGRYCYDVTP
jgi:general secretion pathway protein G